MLTEREYQGIFPALQSTSCTEVRVLNTSVIKDAMPHLWIALVTASGRNLLPQVALNALLN